MFMTERLHKLLKILEKRDPTTPGLKERIDRVKADLGQVPMPAPLPKSKKSKKKIKGTDAKSGAEVEIEVDEE